MDKNPPSRKKMLLDRTKKPQPLDAIKKDQRHRLDHHAITRQFSAGEKCGLALHPVVRFTDFTGAYPNHTTRQPGGL
jgi:hypothetical protein